MELPREPFRVEKWEVKLGWNPQEKAWSVMVLLEIGEKTTLDLVFPAPVSEALGEGLIAGAERARKEPPHPIGSAH